MDYKSMQLSEESQRSMVHLIFNFYTRKHAFIQLLSKYIKLLTNYMWVL